MTDIFSIIDNGCRNHLLPPSVTICGAGPNGVPYLNHCQNDYLIALNSIVRYRLPWRWWLVFDEGALTQPWFDKRPPKRCQTLFSQYIPPQMVQPWPCNYTFEWKPPLAHNTGPGMLDDTEITPDEEMPPNVLMHGRLRASCGILGCALQFCAWAGAKYVKLVGCDYYGGEHWDGTYNDNPRLAGIWPTTNRVSRLIKVLEHYWKMEIVSLSKTAIKARSL